MTFNNYKHIVIGLTIFVLLTIPALTLADTPDRLVETMQTANQYYKTGDFSQAITHYESIRQIGINHSDLYYNLGNAYLKQGDIGHAILNYRRAQQLSPRDDDIVLNLTVAREEAVDKIANTPQGMITGLAYLTEYWLTLVEVQYLLLFSWSGLMAWILIIVLWPHSWRNRLTRLVGWGITTALLFPFLLLLGSMFSRVYLQTTAPPVVVVAKVVELTTGPGTSERYPVTFRLHAGAEARLISTESGWRHVILSNNLDGWVPQESVALIDNHHD